jgi:peptidoglycan/LPS O-acetylase OafA/YrhL
VIPFLVYKTFHLVGVTLTIAALGGMAIHAANGGTRDQSLTRRLTTMTHGLGLALVLVAGFGMLARLGGSAGSGWVLIKLAIWLILGAAAFVPYRRPQFARALFLVVPLLAALAAIIAITKPL